MQRTAVLLRLMVVLASMLAWATPFVRAQPLQDAFPGRAVQLVVPFPAGGLTDTLSRLIGAKLADYWKQPVVVDNRGGAFGVIGQNYAQNAPADGHTLLLGITSFTYQSSIKGRTAPDFNQNFVPIGMVSDVVQALLISTSVSASNIKEFSALVTANPGKYSYGTAGSGSTAHVFGELMNAQNGTKMAHVPYRGNAQLMNDLLGGQIPAAFMDLVLVKQHLASGKFRVLAINGPQRAAELPEVPTFTELGYKDFDILVFFGYFVSSKTPPAVVERLSRDLRHVVSQQDVAARLSEMGMRPSTVSPADFARQIRKDKAVWESTVRSRNISVE